MGLLLFRQSKYRLESLRIRLFVKFSNNFSCFISKSFYERLSCCFCLFLSWASNFGKGSNGILKAFSFLEFFCFSLNQYFCISSRVKTALDREKKCFFIASLSSATADIGFCSRLLRIFKNLFDRTSFN